MFCSLRLCLSIIAIFLSQACRSTSPRQNKELLDGALVPSRSGQPADLDEGAPAVGMSSDPSSLWSPASRRAFAMYHFLVAQKAAMSGENAVAEEHFESSYNLDPNSFTGARLARVKVIAGSPGDEGLTEARRMALLYPFDAELRLLFGQALMVAGDLNEGEVQLKKAIELNPSLDESYLALIRCYQSMGQGSRATDVARKLTRIRPTNSEGWTMLSRTLLAEKRAKEALEPARRAWELQENNPETVLIYALTLDLNKKSKEAVKLYEQLYRFNPGNPNLVQRMVALYKEFGNLDTALSLIDDMIENSKEEVPGLQMQKLIILWEMGRNSEALALLSGLEKQFPESDRVNFMYGLGLLKVEQHQQAASRFAMIQDNSPLKPDAMRHQALTLKHMGRLSEALTVLKNLTDRPDADPSGYQIWADILGEQRNFKEAIQIVNAAIKRFPDNSRLLFLKGVYLERDDDRVGAASVMRKVIESNPNDASALNFLGYMLAEDGRELEEAENLVLRALKLEPRNGGFIDSLGWIYFKKKLFQKSLQTLEKARQLEPDEGVIWEHLGDVLVALGDEKKGLEHYKEALKRKNDPRDQKRIKDKHDALDKKIHPKG